MGWDSTNKIMTAPLSLGDISTAIDITSGDLGTLVTSVGTTRKWAKYKPLRSSSITPLTEAQRKALNYGFQVTKFNSISTLTAGVLAGTEWSYLAPQTGQGHKFRATDYVPYDPNSNTPFAGNGYNKNAKCFIEEAQVPSGYTKGGGGTYLRLWMTPQSQLPSGTVHWSDLTNLNDESIELDDCYFGALFVKGTSYMYITTSAKLNSDQYKAELFISDSTLNALATGTWTIYLCFAYSSQSTAITSSGDINNAMRLGVYAVPDVGTKSMTISAAASSASAAIKDDTLDILIGSGRFTVSFGINYVATSSTHSVHATWKIYGGDYSGAKTTEYTGAGGTQDLSATTTLQTYNVSKVIREGFPAYVTVVLTYTIDSDTTVYTAPEVSIPFPDE